MERLTLTAGHIMGSSGNKSPGVRSGARERSTLVSQEAVDQTEYIQVVNLNTDLDDLSTPTEDRANHILQLATAALATSPSTDLPRSLSEQHSSTTVPIEIGTNQLTSHIITDDNASPPLLMGTPPPSIAGSRKKAPKLIMIGKMPSMELDESGGGAAESTSGASLAVPGSTSTPVRLSLTPTSNGEGVKHSLSLDIPTSQSWSSGSTLFTTAGGQGGEVLFGSGVPKKRLQPRQFLSQTSESKLMIVDQGAGAAVKMLLKDKILRRSKSAQAETSDSSPTPGNPSKASLGSTVFSITPGSATSTLLSPLMFDPGPPSSPTSFVSSPTTAPGGGKSLLPLSPLVRANSGTSTSAGLTQQVINVSAPSTFNQGQQIFILNSNNLLQQNPSMTRKLSLPTDVFATSSPAGGSNSPISGTHSPSAGPAVSSYGAGGIAPPPKKRRLEVSSLSEGSFLTPFVSSASYPTNTIDFEALHMASSGSTTGTNKIQQSIQTQQLYRTNPQIIVHPSSSSPPIEDIGTPILQSPQQFLSSRSSTTGIQCYTTATSATGEIVLIPYNFPNTGSDQIMIQQQLDSHQQPIFLQQQQLHHSNQSVIMAPVSMGTSQPTSRNNLVICKMEVDPESDQQYGGPGMITINSQPSSQSCPLPITSSNQVAIDSSQVASEIIIDIDRINSLANCDDETVARIAQQIQQTLQNQQQEALNKRAADSVTLATNAAIVNTSQGNTIDIDNDNFTLGWTGISGEVGESDDSVANWQSLVTGKPDTPQTTSKMASDQYEDTPLHIVDVTALTNPNHANNGSQLDISLPSETSTDTLRHQESDLSEDISTASTMYKQGQQQQYNLGKGKGKYQCQDCGLRCIKPCMLRKHSRSHSKIRPFICLQCHLRFKTKGNLTKHMKSKAHFDKCTLELGMTDVPTVVNDDTQIDTKALEILSQLVKEGKIKLDDDEDRNGSQYAANDNSETESVSISDSEEFICVDDVDVKKVNSTKKSQNSSNDSLTGIACSTSQMFQAVTKGGAQVGALLESVALSEGSSGTSVVSTSAGSNTQHLMIAAPNVNAVNMLQDMPLNLSSARQPLIAPSSIKERAMDRKQALIMQQIEAAIAAAKPAEEAASVDMATMTTNQKKSPTDFGDDDDDDEPVEEEIAPESTMALLTNHNPAHTSDDVTVLANQNLAVSESSTLSNMSLATEEGADDKGSSENKAATLGLSQKIICTICSKVCDHRNYALHMQVHRYTRPDTNDILTTSSSISTPIPSVLESSSILPVIAPSGVTTGSSGENHSSQTSHTPNSASIPSEDNPRPFKCVVCNIGFRVGGHLSKHYRCKAHLNNLAAAGLLSAALLAEIEANKVPTHEIIDQDTGNLIPQVLSRYVGSQSWGRKIESKAKSLEGSNNNTSVDSAISVTDDELSNRMTTNSDTVLSSLVSTPSMSIARTSETSISVSDVVLKNLSSSSTTCSTTIVTSLAESADQSLSPPIITTSRPTR